MQTLFSCPVCHKWIPKENYLIHMQPHREDINVLLDIVMDYDKMKIKYEQIGLFKEVEHE